MRKMFNGSCPGATGVRYGAIRRSEQGNSGLISAGMTTPVSTDEICLQIIMQHLAGEK